MPRPGERRLRGRRHGVRARTQLLAPFVPGPARRSAGRGRHRSPGGGDRPRAVVRPALGRDRAQGLSRRASGPGDLLLLDRPGAVPGLRHPARRLGVRVRRSGRLPGDRGPPGRRAHRQAEPGHRLGAAPPGPRPDRLCARGRNAPAHRLRRIEEEASGQRPGELDRRRSGTAHPSRDLSHRCSRSLAPHQGQGPQAEGPGRIARARRLAGGDGPEPGPAASTYPQGRCPGQARPGAAGDGAGPRTHAAAAARAGRRQVRSGHPGGGRARPRATGTGASPATPGAMAPGVAPRPPLWSVC